MDMGKILREFGVKISLFFDQKKAKEAKKHIEEIGKELKDMTLHVAEASAVLFEMANVSGEHSRRLEENSEQLGINAERLQELQYAAKVAANVNGEELVGSLMAVSKTLDEARRGNVEAAESFVRLGVPLEMVTDRTKRADQVMLAVADRLKMVQDPIARTTLANQVFGASGAKLLPLLNKGSQGIANLGVEARKTGVILNESMIKEGAEFDRTLSKLWIVIKNITFTIGHELIKYLMPLVTQFKNFIVVNKQFISLGIATVMKSVGLYLGIVFTVVTRLLSGFKTLVEIMGGVERVTKLLAIAMGIFTAGKLIWAIGVVTASVRAFAAGITLANAEFLLIGAAVAAFILVIQDIYTFFKGGDSFTGDFVKGIKKWVSEFGVVGGVIGFISDGFKTLVGWIGTALDYAGKFADFLTGGALSKVGSFFGGALDKAMNFVGGGADNAANANTFKSAAPAGAAANSANSSTQNNQIGITQNISVPPGTSASQAASIVSSGTGEALDSMLRQTRNQALGGAAY